MYTQYNDNFNIIFLVIKTNINKIKCAIISKKPNG